ILLGLRPLRDFMLQAHRRIVDVNAGGDKAEETLVAGMARHANILDPAILAVMPEQAVLHAEFFACVETARENIGATLDVIGVDAFGPAIAQRLAERTAREFQPWLIEPGTELVSP